MNHVLGARLPPDRRVSVLESLSQYRAAFLVLPTAVTVALAVALFAGVLPIEWFVIGAILVGPIVVTVILAVDAIRHR